jgi:hypothetical protein
MSYIFLGTQQSDFGVGFYGIPSESWHISCASHSLEKLLNLSKVITSKYFHTGFCRRMHA